MWWFQMFFLYSAHRFILCLYRIQWSTCILIILVPTFQIVFNTKVEIHFVLFLLYLVMMNSWRIDISYEQTLFERWMRLQFSCVRFSWLKSIKLLIFPKRLNWKMHGLHKWFPKSVISYCNLIFVSCITIYFPCV